jgi:hypothetical protein
MSGVFSEINLSDNETPRESNDPPPNVRARRKNYSSSHKHISSSPSPINQINPNTSFHEITSSPPPPPLSLLDISSTSSSFSTPSSSIRYPPVSLSASPPPTTISSEPTSLSPKNLARSSGSLDLTKRTFNFPLSRQDSIFDSLLCAIYERDGSVYGLSSSQDSDTVTTGDCTDQSCNIRRSSGDSIDNHSNTVFLKSNLANKSKIYFLTKSKLITPSHFTIKSFANVYLYIYYIRYTRITTFMCSNATTNKSSKCLTCEKSSSSR